MSSSRLGSFLRVAFYFVESQVYFSRTAVSFRHVEPYGIYCQRVNWSFDDYFIFYIVYKLSFIMVTKIINILFLILFFIPPQYKYANNC
jgi:hypothetical protein